MKQTGFTLIELLVAAALSTVLMAAILVMLAGVSRQRRAIAQAQSTPRVQPIAEQIRWDLVNAATMKQSADGQVLELIGHGGIDPATMMPSGRLSRVIYRCVRPRKLNAVLVREQDYLDDPAHPDPWRELIAANVKSIDVLGAGGGRGSTADDLPLASLGAGNEIQMPSRLRLHIDMGKTHIDKELDIR